MRTIAALVLSTVAGACVLKLLLPALSARLRDAPGRVTQRVGLSFAMGVGIASLLSYLRLELAAGEAAVQAICEGVLVLIALAFAGAAFRLRRATPVVMNMEANDATPRSLRWVVTAVPFVLLGVSAWAWMVRGLASPHGRWDAWAIWNQCARFLYWGGPLWTNHFAPEMAAWTHSDYPLLLPLAVTRLWNYEGEASTTAAVILSISIAVATALIVIGAVRAWRGPALSVVALSTLLGLPVFLTQATQQMADFPTALFMVAALSVAVDALRAEESADAVTGSAWSGWLNRYGTWIAAGFFGGCAACTKREGSLFLLAMTLGLIIAMRFRPGAWGKLAAWAGGALPMFTMLLYVKYAHPVTAELQSIRFNAARLVDVERHKIVWSHTWALMQKEASSWPALAVAMIACVLAFGVDRDRMRSPMAIMCAVTLAVMLAGFYTVYLFTPLDTAFIVDTTATRLLLQLWPMCVLFFCMMLRKPAPRAV